MRYLVFCVFLISGLTYSSSLIGCSSTVVTGGLRDSAFSPGDGRFQLGIEARGPRGRSYTAYNKKKVAVSIVRVASDHSVAVMFRREYDVLAGDLTWVAEWSNGERVSLLLLDRVHTTQLSGAPRPSRAVKSILLTKQGERFVSE